ncbi:MAG TPA: hypothetical protein ENN67_02555, partial [Firmicutes bacterium]|nr:hypothetical protein [Bacillota bacterium]
CYPLRRRESRHRDHPDLYENVINGQDFISPPGDGLGGETPGDGEDNNGDGVVDGNVGHGTHCAGIAAAVGNNNEGVAGHTWHTKILPCRVFPIDGDSGAMDSSIAEAITWAANQGATVGSLSLGSFYPSSSQQSAINYAWNSGTVIVAAAGNSNSSQPFYPAAAQNVISVAATTNNDTKASFSNYGSTIDVSAPGLQIVSSYFYTHSGDPWSVPENQRYASLSGTSMACPQVSGLVGLVASYFPTYSQAELADQVIFTADNIDAQNPQYVGLLGSGRINAYRALTTPLEAEFEIVSLWSDDDHPLYSQGNRDGFLNPAETIEFRPTVRNIGLKGAPNCTITLTGGDGYIDIFNETISLGYLDRGKTVTPSDPFVFRIRQDVIDSKVIELSLNFEYTNGVPKEISFNVTVRKDLGIVDIITCSGENMLGDRVPKGKNQIPALSFTIEGDMNYGTLKELIVTQTGTVDNSQLGEVQLWLDSNGDGKFANMFDTRIAYRSYDHPGYRGIFDDVNDPQAGFGEGIRYVDHDPVYFDSNGLAHFYDCVLPTAPEVPRTIFIVFNVLPTAETGSTVQIGVMSALDVIVKAPDQVSMLNFPIQSDEVPIVGTWLDPLQLTINGPSTETLYSWRPETAVCPITSNVYMVFDTNRNGNFDVMLMRSTDTAESFQSPVLLDTSNANEFFPDVQVDSEGVVHVVYYSTKITNRREIYYVRSTDFGVTFEEPVRLTNAQRDSRTPKIAIGPDDTIHMAWHDNRVSSTNYQIYYKQSIDGGDSWSDDLMVANTSNSSEEAAIAVGGDGVIHITWEQRSGWNSYNVFYSRSTDDGQSFSSVVTLSGGSYANRCYYSDIGADNNGNVYAIYHWISSSGAEIVFRKSMNSGESWGSTTRLTNNSIPDSRPGIHVMPDGSFIDIVWRVRESDVWNIFHTFSEDGLDTWEEAVQISNSTGGDARAAVVVRSKEWNIFAFWEDVVNAYGSYEVFYNRYIY